MFYKNLISKVAAYLTIFYTITFLLLILLRHHYNKSFTKDRLENMITKVSLFRDKTDNLCKYSIFGDPTVLAEYGYVKISFYCQDGSSSINSLSLSIFKQKKIVQVSDIVDEISRILNFDKYTILSENSRWKCFYDTEEKIPISQNYNDTVATGKNIFCYEK